MNNITQLLYNFSNWSKCINNTIKKRSVTIYDTQGNIYRLPNQNYIFKTIELCPIKTEYSSDISVSKFLEITAVVLVCILACMCSTKCIIKYS